MKLSPNDKAWLTAEKVRRGDGLNSIVTPTRAFSWLTKLATGADASLKARSIWKFTPAALTQIAMLSDGKGRYIGDLMVRENADLYLFGCRVEIDVTATPLECRFAFVDTESEAEDWYYFSFVRPIEVATAFFDPTDSPS